jgi:hypothetical protein
MLRRFAKKCLSHGSRKNGGALVYIPEKFN